MFDFDHSNFRDANECRRLANACRKSAAAASDARAEYLAIAEYWDGLTKEYERLAGFEAWHSAKLNESRTRH